MNSSIETVEDLAVLASSLDLATFAARLGGPVLIGEIPNAAEDDDAWSFNTVSMIETIAGMEDGKEFILRAEDTALVVRKSRAGAVFAQTVLVGRADSNDVCVRHSSISKLHAHFIRDASDGWTLLDTSSQNGTYINTERVIAEVPNPINDSDWIRFGECTFQYYSIQRLHRVLTQYMPKH